MKRKNIVFLAIAVFLIIAFYLILSKDGKEDLEAEILVENLDTPWAIDFLPDGNMVFTERPGKVSTYDFGKKERIVIAEIPASEISESGLMGIAVDPEFEENKLVYLYYTYEDNGTWNRISRYKLESNRLVDEKILLDKIPAARFHDGGRLKFGPDGKLYATTGDATVPSSSQDTNSLSGKILRLDKDGAVPADNPFGNYVYSYGHRNPQGLAWNADKQMYASEHGQTQNDEINIIKKGENYGWPTECDEPSDYTYPIRCYTEFTLAPAGIAFYKNDLYVAALRGTQLRKIVFDENYETILNEEELFSNMGRIREAVEYAGYLYISTSNNDGRGIPAANDDRIIRIRILQG
ncbi:PQQ-dependent sugar dehydrogenase [Candidatus Woesearchaeota archaeon]|nr:PQQ-dependent sugar dehydrogenase [Candidatus Woesearchaeota archaeon]